MRVKTVEYDGQEFRIGELTFEQVEAFFGEGRRANLMDLVLASLNNAVRRAGLPPDSPKAEFWTRERLRHEMGPVSFKLLRDDILSYSKIEVQEGEAPAPSESGQASTSEKSAAA